MTKCLAHASAIQSCVFFIRKGDRELGKSKAHLSNRTGGRTEKVISRNIMRYMSKRVIMSIAIKGEK